MGDAARVGQIIYTARVRRGWSQAELSRHTGADDRQIASWESGQELPDLSDIQSLSSLLELQPDEFAALREEYGEAFGPPLVAEVAVEEVEAPTPVAPEPNEPPAPVSSQPTEPIEEAEPGPARDPLPAAESAPVAAATPAQSGRGLFVVVALVVVVVIVGVVAVVVLANSGGDDDETEAAPSTTELEPTAEPEEPAEPESTVEATPQPTEAPTQTEAPETPEPTSTPEPTPRTAEFGSVGAVSLNGSATMVDGTLQLTESVNESQVGSAWSQEVFPFAAGFSTEFTFEIGRRTADAGDGLAFVLQIGDTDALGRAGSGIGYEQIPQSVAVEIDGLFDSVMLDAGGPHFSVNSGGAEPNFAHHDHSFGLTRTGWPEFGVQGPLIDNGLPHTVRVTYVPGFMTVHLDDIPDPFLGVWIDLGELLGADQLARVGFTAATRLAAGKRYTVTDWSFTPLDASGAEIPAGVAPEAFSGTWTGSGLEGQSILTVGCCDQIGIPVVLELNESQFCGGRSATLTGTGRVTGGLLNVGFDDWACTGGGGPGFMLSNSYVLNPDGTLTDTRGVDDYSRQ